MAHQSVSLSKVLKSVEGATTAVDQQAALQKIINDDACMQCLINAVENQVADETCNVLLQNLLLLYQSGTNEAQIFVLHFVPAIIWMHLSNLKSSNKVICIADAILLSIYNKKVSEHTDTPFAKSYRMPSLSKPSIYHEPIGLVSPMSALTEIALSRHEQAETPILIQGPKKHLDRIPAQYRPHVIGAVLSRYNNNITYMAESAHISFCVMAIRLVRSGYPMRKACFDIDDIISLSDEKLEKLSQCTRIRLESNIIEQLVTGIHFIMYDGVLSVARQAIDDLMAYASFSLSSVAILLTQALGKLNEMPFDQPTSILDGLPNVLNPSIMPRRKKDPLPATRGRLSTITRRRKTADGQPLSISIPLANKELISNDLPKEENVNGHSVNIPDVNRTNVNIANVNDVSEKVDAIPPEVNSIVFNHSYGQLRRVKSFERKQTVIRSSSATELRTRSLIANETTIKVQLENANPIIIQSRSVCQSAVSLSPAAETEL